MLGSDCLILASPLASVIILNFNGESCLQDCLRSVLANDYPNYEVLLVDNNSSDNSLEAAEASFGGDPHLKIIKNKQNLGFSGGNNLGFNYSQGQYVVFLNNDTIVNPNWLSALVIAMEKDQTIGLAQSLIYTIKGDKVLNAGWIFNSFLVNKFELCNNRTSNLKFKPIFEISFPCGASMMIRRELVQKIGLFDAKIPFFYDDTLLALKTWLSGKRVVTVSDSKIRHISGATNVWKIRFTTYHLLKSTICLLFDSYPRLIDLSRASLVTGANLATNTLFCIKNGNSEAVLGSLQAIMWSLRNFKYIWHNKATHWSGTRISPETLAQRFMRIRLPTPLYLVPSRLASSCRTAELRAYEECVIKKEAIEKATECSITAT